MHAAQTTTTDHRSAATTWGLRHLLRRVERLHAAPGLGSRARAGDDTTPVNWYDTYTIHALVRGSSKPLYFRWSTQWQGVVKAVWQVSLFPCLPGRSQRLRPAGLLASGDAGTLLQSGGSGGFLRDTVQRDVDESANVVHLGVLTTTRAPTGHACLSFRSVHVRPQGGLNSEFRCTHCSVAHAWICPRWRHGWCRTPAAVQDAALWLNGPDAARRGDSSPRTLLAP